MRSFVSSRSRMARSVVLLATIALLAGCSSPEPGIEVRTVEVPGPIRVTQCIDAKDIPRKPAALPRPRPKNISQALDVSVAKVLEHQSYADKADALLRGCAG
jgi:hypothetical protein